MPYDGAIFLVSVIEPNFAVLDVRIYTPNEYVNQTPCGTAKTGPIIRDISKTLRDSIKLNYSSHIEVAYGLSIGTKIGDRK